MYHTHTWPLPFLKKIRHISAFCGRHPCHRSCNARFHPMRPEYNIQLLLECKAFKRMSKPWKPRKAYMPNHKIFLHDVSPTYILMKYEPYFNPWKQMDKDNSMVKFSSFQLLTSFLYPTTRPPPPLWYHFGWHCIYGYETIFQSYNHNLTCRDECNSCITHITWHTGSLATTNWWICAIPWQYFVSAV